MGVEVHMCAEVYVCVGRFTYVYADACMCTRCGYV